MNEIAWARLCCSKKTEQLTGRRGMGKSGWMDWVDMDVLKMNVSGIVCLRFFALPSVGLLLQ